MTITVTFTKILIMRVLLLLFSFIAIVQTSNSQVLISILLGDKLNSEKLEFGLDGGANFSNLIETDGDFKSNFNIGFYFNIGLKNPDWQIATGVIVKSTMGASGLPVYSVGDALLDSVFVGGSVHRKLRYFNVPILIKYKIGGHFFLEGGAMLGLRHKAFDVFSQSVKEDDDTEFTNKIKSDIRAIDAGAMGGIGYKIKKMNGMHFGARYYHGLVNVMKDDAAPKQYNQSIYLLLGIPIGAGKANANATSGDAPADAPTP